MASAASFCSRTTSPARVIQKVTELTQRLTQPSGAMVFLAGDVGQRSWEIARGIAEASLGVPMLVGVGTGVLSEKEEIEGESAAASVCWSGGPTAVPSSDSDLVKLFDKLEPSSGAVFTLVDAQSFHPGAFRETSVRKWGTPVFGAGTVGRHSACLVDAENVARRAPVVALTLAGPAPLVATTRGFSMLGPFRRITRAEGANLMQIGGEDALIALSHAGSGLTGQPLIFLALAKADSPENSPPPEVLLRPIHGVDPVRGSILVGDDVSEEYQVAFAISEASAARSDLQNALRLLSQDARGALPRFAVYANCAGRGARMYGTSQVDVRLIRARLGEIPLAGLNSAFEIAPFHDHPTFQVHTGVLGVFSAPS